jgi:hypothetical protein
LIEGPPCAPKLVWRPHLDAHQVQAPISGGLAYS